MKARVCGSGILLFVAVLAFFCGGVGGAVWLILGLAVGSLWEFSDMLRSMGWAPMRGQLLLWTVLMLLLPWYFPAVFWSSLVLFGALLGFSLSGVLTRRPGPMISSLLSSLVALVYIAFPLHFGVLMLVSEGDRRTGLIRLIWVFLVCKLSDMGGLFVGKLFGNNRIAPDYSPKKTWEGFIGGLLLSLFGSLLFIRFFASDFPCSRSFLMVLTIAISALSAISDLVESAFKREARVKDSGRMIPGIGGFLDLADSLLLTLPFAFFALTFCGKFYCHG